MTKYSESEFVEIQLLFLEELGISWEDIDLIEGAKVHQYVDLPDAYANGEFVVFVECPISYAERFLYYIGAEKEARLEAYFNDMAIYSNVDPDRLLRFLPDKKRK